MVDSLQVHVSTTFLAQPRLIELHRTINAPVNSRQTFHEHPVHPTAVPVDASDPPPFDLIRSPFSLFIPAERGYAQRKRAGGGQRGRNGVG